MEFWKLVADFIETAKEIQDADTLIFNLQTYFPEDQQEGIEDAFYPGSGGEALCNPLFEAGWKIDFTEGDYWWIGTPPDGTKSIEYIEGDVKLLEY